MLPEVIKVRMRLPRYRCEIPKIIATAKLPRPDVVDIVLCPPPARRLVSSTIPFLDELAALLGSPFNSLPYIDSL